MVVMMCVMSGCGARDNTGEAATESETNTGTDMITVRELFEDSKSYNNLDAYIYDGEYIEELNFLNEMEENRVAANKILPAYSQISKTKVYYEEFEKTPKRSIKRYLYQG